MEIFKSATCCLVPLVLLAGCGEKVLTPEDIADYQPWEVATLYCESLKILDKEQLTAILEPKMAKKLGEDIDKLSSDKREELLDKSAAWDCTARLDKELPDGRAVYSFPKAPKAKRIAISTDENGLYVISNK
ncbi:hypothetical protein JC525_03165 [Alteromonas sp. IB21]|uniref:hypothetical protein n=1 Tax=Alteromonas sp. IB21 TaxID=2779369 RepID=UPI0018E74077|nr:hypothetical protein [Alteromonas sp. IB21]MBJ2127929.1 hypothetical protein [Alteromonas sp. IB21]